MSSVINPPPMTREDATAIAVAELPWLDERDINGLLDGTPEEQKLIIASYKTAGIQVTASGWSKFVAIMGVVVEIAGAVTGISSAVASVYSLKTAL